MKATDDFGSLFCYNKNNMETQNTIEQYLPTYREDFKTDSRWVSKTSEHYIFHYFHGSVAEKEIDLIEKTQETGFDKIIKFLNIFEPERKIQYYFYPDGETKENLMGDDWFAQAIYKDFIVHVLYTEKDKPIGEHEDTHLLSLPWGHSVALFQEGLAEYMVGKNWFGEDHNKIAREGLEKNVLPSISDTLEHKKWLELPDEYVIYYYGLVGSFTKFLIETFSKEKFKELYQNTNRIKTKKENCDIFTKIYGISPEEMEEKWKKYILEN